MFKKILLIGGFFNLVACTPADFFIGKRNLPKSNPAPVINKKENNILWNYKFNIKNNDLWLKPAVYDQKVYAVSRDGLLVSLDSKTGKVLSSKNLNNDITGGVLIANNLLFVGTKSGDLWAINPVDFETIWRAELKGEMTNLPEVDDNQILARTINGVVSSFDFKGKLQWRYYLDESIYGLLGNSKPVLAGGLAVIANNSGFLTILKAKDGVLLAEQKMAIPKGANKADQLIDLDANPLVNKEIMFGSSYHSNVFAMDLSKGSLVWQNKDFFTNQDFVLSGDLLIFIDQKGDLIGLNQKDGKLVFENKDYQWRKLSPPILINNKIASIDFEGYFYLFDSSSGKLLSVNKVAKTNSLQKPVIIGNTLVYQLVSGKILAILVN